MKRISMTRIIRTYHELIAFSSFEERFDYLKLNGSPGRPTFGHERWMNQRFYTSNEWKAVRDFVISRDDAHDLAAEDRPILGRIMIHHMVPLRPDDLTDPSEILLNPEYLISCSLSTHNAIHFGDKSQIGILRERQPNDTSPWLH